MEIGGNADSNKIQIIKQMTKVISDVLLMYNVIFYPFI